MARSGQTAATNKKRRPTVRSAQLSASQIDRFEQSKMLRTPRVRALWPRLTVAQQRLVHAPDREVGHGYPLTSGDLAKLTGLSKRQIQYWADRGLVPSWRKNSRRLFESVGLIVAFSLVNSNQSERQFYRRILTAPIEDLTAQVCMLSSVVAARLEDVDDAEAAALTAVLDTIPHR